MNVIHIIYFVLQFGCMNTKCTHLSLNVQGTWVWHINTYTCKTVWILNKQKNPGKVNLEMIGASVPNTSYETGYILCLHIFGSEYAIFWTWIAIHIKRGMECHRIRDLGMSEEGWVWGQSEHPNGYVRAGKKAESEKWEAKWWLMEGGDWWIFVSPLVLQIW